MLFKLALNVLAVIVVVIYSRTLDAFESLAGDPGAGLAELRAPAFVLHSVLALLVVVVATWLAIYQPRGMTAYGHRKQREQREDRIEQHRPVQIVEQRRPSDPDSTPDTDRDTTAGAASGPPGPSAG